MTLHQFRKMKVFAIRMIPSAIGKGRWRKALHEHVVEILSRLDDTCFSCHWSHIKSWDQKTRHPDNDGTCRFALSDGRMLLCDFMSDYCYERGLCREVEDRHGYCQEVESKLASALNCCIRAACDVAVHPSGGVLGWTAGDIRQMWHGRPVPKWVTEFWQGDFHTFPDATPVWL